MLGSIYHMILNLYLFYSFSSAHSWEAVNVYKHSGYDPLKWDFIAFKMKIISMRERTVDMDIVNDVTYMHQSVITRVVIRFL